ncbi:MAG: DUF2911 domain-containing protein [Ferruginibacter sp.]|nr:DUF2911 domain-containing protein [Ferruginibacter sp.]
MKKLFAIALVSAGLFTSLTSCAQNEDKSKRPSPPAKVSEKLASGATVTINYSQPSVKGRTIGKDIEPMDGQVWRTGANEATVFETDKAIKVGGQTLPAGKYALFTIFNGDDVTVIFNKTANQWGAYKYKAEDDALRIKTKATVASPAAEKFTFNLSPNAVTFMWGAKKVSFPVS